MASKIDWTDAIGPATLSNGRAVPMDRFAAWVPRRRPIGPAETALGTGQRYAFVFRRDFTASFEIRGIPNTSMSLMLRLQDHLLSGGTVSVTTGDSLASVYPTCQLAPDVEPAIAQSDARELEYTFAVTLINIAASPVEMIAVY